MDLAFITPTTYLERYSRQGDIYLALAHLIDDEGTNEYACFHRREAEKGRRVILDNGLFEDAQVDTDSLLQRARAIKASVVCAPDVLYDSAGTIKEFKAFIRAKQEVGLQCDVMGIPQADNPDAWWECFRFMELSSDCNLIGLSILSIPQSFESLAWPVSTKQLRDARITNSRIYLLRQLISYTSLLGRRCTPCHLLGLGESLADITFANRTLTNTVISNDSSSAFIHGKNNVRIDKLGIIPGGKNPEKVDFGQLRTLSSTQEKAVDDNIQTALQLAHYNWAQYEHIGPPPRYVEHKAFR